MNLIINFKKIECLKLANLLFIILPFALIGALCISGVEMNLEVIMNQPTILSNFIQVMTYPFCYLILKDYINNISIQKDLYLLPLWIMSILHFVTSNYICSLLIALGMYQIYKKEMFDVRRCRINSKNRNVLLGLLPLVIMYMFIIFIKIRLGLYW